MTDAERSTRHTTQCTSRPAAPKTRMDEARATAKSSRIVSLGGRGRIIYRYAPAF